MDTAGFWANLPRDDEREHEFAILRDRAIFRADSGFTGPGWLALGNRKSFTRHAMRSLILFLSGAAAALLCVWLVSCDTARQAGAHNNTFSSFDPPKGPAAALQFEAGMLKLADADSEQVLRLYQEVSARTIVHGTNLPQVKISLHNQTPLTRVETLQLLDTALMQNGITMVLVGDATVKAVPNQEAGSEVPPTFEPVIEELPDSGSFMTCSVRLKHADPKDATDVLKPASRNQNGSIICLPAENLIILRDYSANVRQMLRLLQQVDQPKLPFADLLGPSPNKPGKRR
jgi:hypothetical protein